MTLRLIVIVAIFSMFAGCASDSKSQTNVDASVSDAMNSAADSSTENDGIGAADQSSKTDGAVAENCETPVTELPTNACIEPTVRAIVSDRNFDQSVVQPCSKTVGESPTDQTVTCCLVKQEPRLPVDCARCVAASLGCDKRCRAKCLDDGTCNKTCQRENCPSSAETLRCLGNIFGG